MEVSEAIKDLQNALEEVKESGKDTVAVSALERYLKDLEEDATESIELRKLSYERTLAHYDAENKHSIAMFESVLEAGRKALKAILIINGGAVMQY